MSAPTSRTPLIAALRRLIAYQPAAESADGELLRRFVGTRDEVAFQTLVSRYGAMVLGVCRGVLRNEADAEDAFQATFLALARNAASVRTPAALAGWLHGVACRIARKAKIAAARRQTHEARVPDPGVQPPPDLAWAEVQEIIHDELQGLPERYRGSLVLCYLSGRKQEEAAQMLGLSKACIKKRLERGRELLRAALTRRGMGPAGVLAAVALPAIAPSATLAATTAALAARFATGAAPAALSELLNEGVKPMFAGKLVSRTTLLALTMLGSIVLLAGVVAFGALPLPPAEPPAPPAGAGPTPAEPPKDDPLPAGVLARFGSGRLRHAGQACAVAFSPDGKILVTGGEWDAYVRLWDAETGRLIRQFAVRKKPSDGASVYSMAFSSDGKRIAVAGHPSTGVWEVETGQEVWSNENRTARFIGFLSGRDTLVYGGVWEKLILTCDPATGIKPAPLPLPPRLWHAAAFSADGKRVAVAEGKTIHLLDPVAREVVREFQGNTGHVTSVAFTPDNRSLATGADDSAIRLWDVATGKVIWEVAEERPEGQGRTPAVGFDGVRSVAFAPDGKTLAVGVGRAVRLLTAATGKDEGRLEGPPDKVESVSFTPDGTRLAGGCYGGTVHIWDLKSRKELFPHSGHSGRVNGLAFTPNGKTLFTAGADGTVREWEPATGRELRRMEGHDRIVNHLAFDPKSGLLATGGWDQTIRLWDPKTGKEVRRIQSRPDDGRAVAFTPDGRVLAAANGDGSVHLWDTRTGRAVAQLEGHKDGPAASVAFSLDGKLLASGGKDQTVRLWDWAAGKEVRVLEGHTYWVAGLAFAPDGRTLASGGGKRVFLWDLASGQKATDHEITGDLVAFSPDGRALATAEWHGAIRVWEALTGKERCRFECPSGFVTSIVFAPDGRAVGTSISDGTTYLWDLTQGAGRPTAAELDGLWADLGGEDVARAHRAKWGLVAASAEAVALLKERVVPVVRTAEQEKQIARLVADLDSEDFVTREAATKELARFGDLAESALRRVVRQPPTAEAGRRADNLLKKLDPALTPRSVRAVEVLEQIDTVAAWEVLAALAKGDPEARLSREAKAAAARKEGRPHGP